MLPCVSTGSFLPPRDALGAPQWARKAVITTDPVGRAGLGRRRAGLKCSGLSKNAVVVCVPMRAREGLFEGGGGLWTLSKFGQIIMADRCPWSPWVPSAFGCAMVVCLCGDP